MGEESEFIIEGMEETTKRVNELVKKIREAREIANELASVEIKISDKRQKDIMEHIIELREDFIKNAGHEPCEFLLVAKGHCFEIHKDLNV